MRPLPQAQPPSLALPLSVEVGAQSIHLTVQDQGSASAQQEHPRQDNHQQNPQRSDAMPKPRTFTGTVYPPTTLVKAAKPAWRNRFVTMRLPVRQRKPFRLPLLKLWREGAAQDQEVCNPSSQFILTGSVCFAPNQALSKEHWALHPTTTFQPCCPSDYPRG
jgi:hypothetical protein